MGQPLLKDRPSEGSGLRTFTAGDVEGWVEDFSVATVRSVEFAQRYLADMEVAHKG